MQEKGSSTRNPASPSGWKSASKRRRNAKQGAKGIDPERVRQIESLRLARTEMQRQMESTAHQARKQQLSQAIVEIDKRLAALSK